MEPFLFHVFICDQKKAEGIPSCSAGGSGAVHEVLLREVARQGMIDEVQITTCGSLGLCEHGPNMVVYPEGIWYCGVSPDDVPEIVLSHFKEGIPVERLMRIDTSHLRAEILLNREKREAAFRAREAAAAVPDELLFTLRGFQESRIILSAIELDVFSAIGDGAKPETVAGRLATDFRATEMLLNALTAIGLLAKKQGIFLNTRIAARYLASGSPDNAREGLMHTANLWCRWSTLTECVRAGTMVLDDRLDKGDEQWTRAFIAAMDRNAMERAPQVVRAVKTEGVRRMLDVGGGSGAYAIAFALASKELQAEILDLGHVIPITDRHIEKAGLSGRVRARPGDLRFDRLGTDFDLILVSAICHMLDPGENRDLLKRCYQALAPQGRLVVQDFILEPDKTAPKSAALFALNMLVGTRGGSSYSMDEYAEWLREAGFDDVRHVLLPGPASLMLGTRI